MQEHLPLFASETLPLKEKLGTKLKRLAESDPFLAPVPGSTKLGWVASTRHSAAGWEGAGRSSGSNASVAGTESAIAVGGGQGACRPERI